MRDEPFADDLLAWYDVHARHLPWRISPRNRALGEKPDRYRVWLSEIMLQQTTVATVTGYYARFLSRWPTVTRLAQANDGDVMGEWAGLGYYARARNLLKCSRVVADDLDGQFPDTYAELLTLPGIGPYTAAAIAAICHESPEPVVDGNVKRVLARYFAVQETLDKAMPTILARAKQQTPQRRTGDYAQAVMDLGATICTPRKPNCGTCPCKQNCRALALDIVAELPRKPLKAPKPTRNGIVYIAKRSDGAWLLERRPPKGLLGGMLGWPGSEWADDPNGTPPINGNWVTQNTIVQHTFTHFHLNLTLQTVLVGPNAQPRVGTFLPANEFRPFDLPTVMRKAYDAAVTAFAPD